MEIEWTHQLLACADDVSVLEDNIGTINKNIETSIDASREVCLESKRRGN
jgi:hypothetical protein